MLKIEKFFYTYLVSVAILMLVLVFWIPAEADGPRTFGKKGTATTTNATITAPFHPVMICVRNDDATNGLYVDWTDGVATTGDESTNLYLAPGEGNCYTFVSNISPNRSFNVGVLAAAATTAFHFNMSRGN